MDLIDVEEIQRILAVGSAEIQNVEEISHEDYTPLLNRLSPPPKYPLINEENDSKSRGSKRASIGTPSSSKYYLRFVLPEDLVWAPINFVKGISHKYVAARICKVDEVKLIPNLPEVKVNLAAVEAFGLPSHYRYWVLEKDKLKPYHTPFTKDNSLKSKFVETEKGDQSLNACKNAVDISHNSWDTDFQENMRKLFIKRWGKAEGQTLYTNSMDIANEYLKSALENSNSRRLMQEKSHKDQEIGSTDEPQEHSESVNLSKFFSQSEVNASEIWILPGDWLEYYDTILGHNAVGRVLEIFPLKSKNFKNQPLRLSTDYRLRLGDSCRKRLAANLDDGSCVRNTSGATFQYLENYKLKPGKMKDQPVNKKRELITPPAETISKRVKRNIQAVGEVTPPRGKENSR